MNIVGEINKINSSYEKIATIDAHRMRIAEEKKKLDAELKAFKVANPSLNFHKISDDKKKLVEQEKQTLKEIEEWKINKNLSSSKNPDNEYKCTPSERTNILRKAKNIELALTITFVALEILAGAAIIAAAVVFAPHIIIHVIVGSLVGFFDLIIIINQIKAHIEKVNVFSSNFEVVRKSKCLNPDFKYFVTQYLNDVQLTNNDLIDVRLHRIYDNWRAHLGSFKFIVPEF